MKRCLSFWLVTIGICGLLFSQSIPDFTLNKIDGSVFKWNEHLGKKIYIIEFWATWCKPCKKFLKKLNKIHLDYNDRVNVIAISVDDSSALSKVDSYIKGKKFHSA